MKAEEILEFAREILKNRGDLYGDATICFERASTIATIILGKQITAYDVALIQVALKLARIPESPQVDDHYIDLINYTAFGLHLTKCGEPNIDANEATSVAAARRPAEPKEPAHEKDDDRAWNHFKFCQS